MLPETLILGVDALPGASPQSSSQPRFALALINSEGRLLKSLSDVSLRRLLQIAKAYAPRILAIDNVFELAPSAKELIRLARSTPVGLKVVQVTGAPNFGFQPLEVLARKHGISTGSKLSPAQSAEACARLAQMGVGFELLFFENETKITVSKGRGGVAGGMSQARFQRGVQTAVLRATKIIEKKLRDAGLDFDLEIKRSPHGLESSIFVVYASRDKLKGIVKPVRHRDLKISVAPVYKKEIEYKSLKSQELLGKLDDKYLIVGIDPGMVTGVAALSLDCDPIFITSGRGLSRGQISRLIASHGKPVVIASDVNPPPDMIAKLSIVHDAVLFAPPKSLLTSEKQSLVQSYISSRQGVSVKDTHQRDALAAALKAYQAYKNKLEQCVAHIKNLSVNVSTEQVKALVIKGKSIKEAVNIASSKYLKTAELKTEPRPPELRPQMSEKEEKLKEAIRSLAEEKRALEAKLSELSLKIEELERSVEELRKSERLEVKKSQEIVALSQEVEVLKQTLTVQRAELSSLKGKLNAYAATLKSIAAGHLKPIKPLKAITRDSLNELKKTFGIECGDLIYLHERHALDEKAIEELSKLKVKAILTPSPDAHFSELLARTGLLVLGSEEFGVTFIDDIPLVSNWSKLEEEVKKRSRELEIKAKQAAAEGMAKLLSDYRAKRVKELLLS